MSKPSQTFIWSTTGTKVDPGGTKTGAGFVHGDRFPFQWANFLLHLIEQWITWLYAFVTAVDTRREQPWQALVDVLQDRGETLTLPTSYLAGTSCALLAGYDSGYGAAEVLALGGVNVLQLSLDLGITWTDMESSTNTWGAIASAYRANGSWAVVAVSQTGKVRSVTRAGAAATVNSVQTLSGSPDLIGVAYDWYQDMWIAWGAGGLWYAVDPASTWTRLNTTTSYTSVTIFPIGGAFSAWILPAGSGTAHRSIVTSQVPAATTVLAAVLALSANQKVTAYDRLGAKLVITDGTNKVWTSGDGGDTIASTTTLTASSVVVPIEWQSHVLLAFADALGAISLRMPHGACVPAQLTTSALASSAYFTAVACPFVMLAGQIPNWGSRVMLHTGASDVTLWLSRRPRAPVAAGDIA